MTHEKDSAPRAAYLQTEGRTRFRKATTRMGTLRRWYAMWMSGLALMELGGAVAQA